MLCLALAASGCHSDAESSASSATAAVAAPVVPFEVVRLPNTVGLLSLVFALLLHLKLKPECAGADDHAVRVDLLDGERLDLLPLGVHRVVDHARAVRTAVHQRLKLERRNRLER